MGATAHRLPRPEGSHLGLIAALLALAAIASVLTAERMHGMDGGPGTDLGALGFYVTTWVVMMAAMMFPSAAPMVRTYALVLGRRRSAPPALGVTAFVGGYLLAWAAFGLLAYAAFALVSGLEIEAFSWERGGPYLAGAVIAAAAAYQATPLKNACLTRCRGPLGFLTERWRDGIWGGLRLGVEHGGWCVGCCWALMAALFALGVMGLGWMAAIAAVVAIEKLLPWRRVASWTLAAILLALALGVAFAPEQVPGLTLPGEGGMSAVAVADQDLCAVDRVQSCHGGGRIVGGGS